MEFFCDSEGLGISNEDSIHTEDLLQPTFTLLKAFGPKQIRPHQDSKNRNCVPCLRLKTLRTISCSDAHTRLGQKDDPLGWGIEATCTNAFGCFDLFSLICQKARVRGVGRHFFRLSPVYRVKLFKMRVLNTWDTCTFLYPLLCTVKIFAFPVFVLAIVSVNFFSVKKAETWQMA